MREIPYAIGLVNKSARYNPTFPDSRIDAYLNYLSRYFPIYFRRVSNFSQARYTILFGPTASSRTAAQTSASQRRTTVSQSFNFGRNDLYCGRVIVHEFGHCLNTAFVHLSGNFDFMSEYAGTAGNLTQRDCDYFYAKAYGYRSALRPWVGAEANMFNQVFSNPVTRSGDDGLLCAGLEDLGRFECCQGHVAAVESSVDSDVETGDLSGLVP